MTWNEAREDWLNFFFYFTFDSSNFGAQIRCPQNRYTDVKFGLDYPQTVVTAIEVCTDTCQHGRTLKKNVYVNQPSNKMINVKLWHADIETKIGKQTLL